MKQQLSRHGSLIFVGICLIATALIAPLGVSAARGTPPPSTPTSADRDAPPDYQHDFGAWSYWARRTNDGRLHVRILYDDRSVSALQAYAAANRGLATQLAVTGGPAEVRVTFRAPMVPEEFRAWAMTVGLTPQVVDLRTTTAKGKRGTLGVLPKAGATLPQELIDEQLAAASQQAGPLTVHGVITVQGTVDAARLTTIADDARVFFPDVTAAFVRRELATAGVTGATGANVIVQPAFWQMENLGLANFR